MATERFRYTIILLAAKCVYSLYASPLVRSYEDHMKGDHNYSKFQLMVHHQYSKKGLMSSFNLRKMLSLDIFLTN